MKIKVSNYIIETSPHASYNLTELKKSEDKDGNPYLREGATYYGVSLERAINIIVHLNLHQNPNELSLKQFLVEYKNEREKIRKLVEIGKLK